MISGDARPAHGEANRLLPFLKKTGVGKNGAKHLERDEAEHAMRAVLEGGFHPVTFGAFFMGLRYKGESAQELAGFLDASTAAMERCGDAPPPGLLNCAGAYDGKERTCNVGIAASLIAAGAGVPVVMHGTRGVPTKYGMTTSHVLESLGVNPTKSLGEVSEDLHRIRIGYADQSVFHPKLHRLLDCRGQVGKRTILNTMETLANPFGAQTHLGGFFHDAYADLICDALRMRSGGLRRATLVKGIEGSDELRPGKVFMARLEGGECGRIDVDADALDLPMHISELSSPKGSLKERIGDSRDRILSLLGSPAKDPHFRNAVLLNAAVRLNAAGFTADLARGIELARDSLDGRRALDVLTRWRSGTGRG